MSNRSLSSYFVFGLAVVAAAGLATSASATPGAPPLAFPDARFVAGGGRGSDLATPLTPEIAVNPTILNFGNCVLAGQCADMVLQVSNRASDPTSILVITSVQVTGAEFNLQAGPTLPDSVPGDGTSHLDFTIRFCPVPGPKPRPDDRSQGQVTITAREATNTPLDVPATGTGNHPPKCNAGGPYSGTVGQPVAMDGSASSDPEGPISSYSWNFGDGSTGDGPTPSHTYATGGVFNVSLTVADSCGATSVCGTTADINAPPVCDAGGPIYPGVVNQPVQFDGTGSSDPDGIIQLYEWDFGDGATGTGPTPTHTYMNPGQFVVTLCVTDDDQARSCCEATADISPPPTAVELVSFTATSTGGAVHLAWRTGAEENHAGFRVLRAMDGSDDYAVASGDELVRDADADHAYAFDDDAVEAGATYTYRLAAVDLRGGEQLFAPLRVSVSRTLPPALVLHPSHPNPFNPSTSIAFDLPEAAAATVRIYSSAGHLVRTLAEREAFEAGSAALPWDGRDDTGTGMPSGVYLVRLEIGARVLTEKIVLAR